MINQRPLWEGGKKCIGKCQPSLFFSQDEPSCGWDANLGSASVYLVTWLVYFWTEGQTATTAKPGTVLSSVSHITDPGRPSR